MTIALAWVCAAGAAALVLTRQRAKSAAARRASEPSSLEDGRDEVVPIGQVRTVFANKRGVPRQGQLAPAVRARIELSPSIISGDALDGLRDFSHAWIVFTFSRNSNLESLQKWRRQENNLFKSKVRPPLLGGKKVGVFASRTPHRPNPIGLTLVKIEAVDVKSGTLDVVGIDVCDGTPVIDIKPLVPADIPQLSQTRFPSWVEVGAKKLYRVEFSPDAEIALKQSQVRGKQFYRDGESLRSAIIDVLKLDVRGVSQNRGKVDGSEIHGVTVDDVHVTFAFTAEDAVLVLGLTQTSAPMGQ